MPSRPRKASVVVLRFRGLRPWAQPLEIRRPRRGVWGRGEKRGRIVGEVSREVFFRSFGGGGLASRWGSCGTGASAGGCAIRCSPHAPRRFPRGWEHQGWTRVRLRAARRVFGIPGSDFRCHFRPSKHYFRPTLALRRARQASDPAKLIEVGSQDFFSGSAAVAAGHLVSADPVEACGVVEKRGEELVGEVVEELGGRWAGMQM